MSRITYLVTKFDPSCEWDSAEDVMIDDIQDISRADLAELKRDVRDGGQMEHTDSEGMVYQVTLADDC